jgi:hypothetical protein
MRIKIRPGISVALAISVSLAVLIFHFLWLAPWVDSKHLLVRMVVYVLLYCAHFLFLFRVQWKTKRESAPIP